MADDVILAISIVDFRFENLHPLTRDLCAAHAADQLLAFSAEHAAADYLDPTQVSALILKLLGHLFTVGPTGRFHRYTATRPHYSRPVPPRVLLSGPPAGSIGTPLRGHITAGRSPHGFYR